MEPAADNPLVPSLIDELRKLLINGGFFDGINLLVAPHKGWVQLHIMAFSTGSLGMLLAALSDDAELDNPDSLSRRITSAGDRAPDSWQYELIAERYPIDQTIVFSARIRLPVSDLAEVVRRFRDRQ